MINQLFCLFLPTMKLTAPNIVSMVRVVIAPIFFFLIISKQSNAILTATILYHIGAFTDFLDGWLARRMKLVSDWGNFFDPLADKVLTGAAFIAFVVLGFANVWMVSIILFRDVFTTYMRILADKQNKPLVTSWTAKVKTFLQMIYISGILILMLIDAYIGSQSHLLEQAISMEIISISLMLLTGLTIWSAIEYIIGNKYIFNKSVVVPEQNQD